MFEIWPVWASSRFCYSDEAKGLLKNKLEKFVAKRVLISFAILSILDLIFIHRRWIVLLGLSIGGAFGLLRFGSMVATFSNLICRTAKDAAVKKSVLWYILNQGVLLILLATAAKFDLWLFAGLAAGILLVPFIMFIFGIAQGLGITHYDFE